MSVDGMCGAFWLELFDLGRKLIDDIRDLAGVAVIRKLASASRQEWAFNAAFHKRP